VDHPQDITARLQEMAGEGALHELVPALYDMLRSLARRHLLGERADHTLSTTDLVHEAFLKLSRLNKLQWQNRAHFLALAARAMRNILVDHAVRRKRQKRGGGAIAVPLTAAHLLSDERDEDLIALDEALSGLEALNARHARIVECRFFVGLTIEETAEAVGVSPATVKRDWLLLRAWLRRTLEPGNEGEDARES